MLFHGFHGWVTFFYISCFHESMIESMEPWIHVGFKVGGGVGSRSISRV